MHSPRSLSRKLQGHLTHHQFIQAGFTMIELLIVIAILGILAVAVLSAINPIEQINRGRDTSSQSDAEQLLTAIDRYVAFQGFLPWQIAAGTTNRGLVIQPFTNAVTDNNTPACPIQYKLGTPAAGAPATCVGTDELKVTFFNRVLAANANPLVIFRGAGMSDTTYVCFQPQSSAFLNQARTRCGGATGAGLPADLSTQGAAICGTAARNIGPAGNTVSVTNELYCIP